MQHSLITLLAVTACVSVLLVLVLLIVVVCLCVYQPQPTTRQLSKEEIRQADEQYYQREASDVVAESAADKATKAAAEAYNFGMSVCAEIKAARGLSVMPSWTPDDFYRHRMSHEVAASRANPNLDGAALVKAVDARVCDDLWHWAPRADPLPSAMPETVQTVPTQPPADVNKTRRIVSDVDSRPVLNVNDYVPGDQQEQAAPTYQNGVEPRKLFDARERMLFGNSNGKE